MSEKLRPRQRDPDHDVVALHTALGRAGAIAIGDQSSSATGIIALLPGRGPGESSQISGRLRSPMGSAGRGQKGARQPEQQDDAGHRHHQQAG